MIHERKASASFFFLPSANFSGCISKFLHWSKGVYIILALHVCCCRMIVHTGWAVFSFWNQTNWLFTRNVPTSSRRQHIVTRFVYGILRSLWYWRWLLISFHFGLKSLARQSQSCKTAIETFPHWLVKKWSGIMHLISIVNMFLIFIHIVFMNIMVISC